MPSEIFNVRATVATHTRAAPARSRTRAHSDAVVPVVKTSSTSKMSRFNDPRWIAHRKSATQVLAPLMASQANLASSLAAPHQHSRRTDRIFSDCDSCFSALRAIISAWLNPRCACLRLCRGTGTTAIFPHGHHRFQVGNRLCQHAPQNCRRGTNLLELEQMDQVAQSAVIAAVGNRPLKRRIRALAEQAPRLSAQLRFAAPRSNIGREVQGLPANRAVRPLQRLQCEQTALRKREAGKLEGEENHRYGNRQERT